MTEWAIAFDYSDSGFMRRDFATERVVGGMPTWSSSRERAKRFASEAAATAYMSNYGLTEDSRAVELDDDIAQEAVLQIGRARIVFTNLRLMLPSALSGTVKVPAGTYDNVEGMFLCDRMQVMFRAPKSKITPEG